MCIYIYMYIYLGKAPQGLRGLPRFSCPKIFPANRRFLGSSVLGPRSVALAPPWGIKVQVPGDPDGTHFALPNSPGTRHPSRTFANCYCAPCNACKSALQNSFFLPRRSSGQAVTEFQLRHENYSKLLCLSLKGFRGKRGRTGSQGFSGPKGN